MTISNADAGSNPHVESALTLLRRLDLATEVLEGLDELGVQNRDQLLDLMDQLEQQIADED
jgi:hypothetical protein